MTSELVNNLNKQERVLNKLHEYNIHDYDNNKIDNNIEKYVIIDQERLQFVINEIDKNIPIYPVCIKRIRLRTPPQAPNRYNYIVMNGNHRITASIIKGFTKIPVLFLN